jgi:hypothetical protein
MGRKIVNKAYLSWFLRVCCCSAGAAGGDQRRKHSARSLTCTKSKVLIWYGFLCCRTRLIGCRRMNCVVFCDHALADAAGSQDAKSCVVLSAPPHTRPLSRNGARGGWSLGWLSAFVRCKYSLRGVVGMRFCFPRLPKSRVLNIFASFVRAIFAARAVFLIHA